MSREQHSADWSAYIERIGPRHWNVVFDSSLLGSFTTREAARVAIRSEKVNRTAKELVGYHLLAKKGFDIICKRFGLDPDDDALVECLVDLGWVFNRFDDEYIAPDRPDPPTGRWRLFLEGLDDPSCLLKR